ncbi:MAG: PqqD family protein [Schwartzia sp.]|nr:PqqD family protein [Schwartzia sp. (in: firmicutes)]
MLEINDQTIFALSPDATLKNILNEKFFLLDKRHGQQYNLTEMEYALLTMIRDRVRFKEIRETICREYDAEESQVDSDVKEYMQSLFEHGLATTAESVGT